MFYVLLSIACTNLFQPQKVTVYNWNILQYILIKKHSAEGVKWLDLNKLSLSKSKYNNYYRHASNTDMQYLPLKIELRSQPEEPRSQPEEPRDQPEEPIHQLEEPQNQPEELQSQPEELQSQPEEL